MRTGLVPPTNSAPNPSAKAQACGRRYGRQSGKKRAGSRKKRKCCLSLWNKTFNDGLCLDATHNKPALCWLPSVSRRHFWHQWRRVCFVYVTKTAGLIPDLHTLEHTGGNVWTRGFWTCSGRQAEQPNWAEGKDRAATRVPSACRKESVATGTGVFDQDRTFHVWRKVPPSVWVLRSIRRGAVLFSRESSPGPDWVPESCVCPGRQCSLTRRRSRKMRYFGKWGYFLGKLASEVSAYGIIFPYF